MFAWIGFEVNLREMSLGISANRAEWAMTWMTRTLENGGILIRELREALGRLVFVYGALTWDKPFLGPLFAWVSVIPQEGEVEIPASDGQVRLALACGEDGRERANAK